MRPTVSDVQYIHYIYIYVYTPVVVDGRDVRYCVLCNQIGSFNFCSKSFAEGVVFPTSRVPRVNCDFYSADKTDFAILKYDVL